MNLQCIFVVILWVVCNVQASEFDVMPGGQKWEMKETLGDVTCVFTYICQGGTKEKWEIVINEQDSQTSICQVKRPDGKSYLFFQEFHVEVRGAKVVDAMVFKNGPREVDVKQFVIDPNSNKVLHSDKFEAELSGIEVLISKTKEEL